MQNHLQRLEWLTHLTYRCTNLRMDNILKKRYVNKNHKHPEHIFNTILI